MLQQGDLDKFVGHYHRAVALGPLTGNEADFALPGDDLYASEIFRLRSSAHILATLDDFPEDFLASIDVISEANQMSNRCSGLEDADKWIRAIRGTFGRPAPHASTRSITMARQIQVGLACRRLRSAGHEIVVGAYGPEPSIEVQRKVSDEIDALIGKMGEDAILTLLAWMSSNSRFHEGMWLFGTSIPGVEDTKTPSLPVGWLLSVAVRNCGKPCVASPEDWDQVRQLATDLAAVLDCERYTMFENFNIVPSEFWRAMVDSLRWRELFSLPQAPANTVKYLLEAIRTVNWPEGSSNVQRTVFAIATQSVALLDLLPDLQAAKFQMPHLMARFPHIVKLGMADLTSVNRDYCTPMAVSGRDHDRFMLFKPRSGHVIALPKSFTASAACHVIIGQIWKELEEKKAGKLVGDIFERMVETACAGKAPVVIPKLKYTVGKQVFEIDLATAEGERVVLFQIKAKILTGQARSGDMTSYVSDYTDSYLSMLDQLTRDEEYLRKGRITLTEDGVDCIMIRPLKVAVSPLSFGPIGDPHLSDAMLRAVANSKYHPVEPEPNAEKKWSAFNNRKDTVMSRVFKLSSPEEMGVPRYLMTVRWLDIGQLIYLLERSTSVWEAVRPCGTVFSSQDFWTEIAHFDRLMAGAAPESNVTPP